MKCVAGEFQHQDKQGGNLQNAPSTQCLIKFHLNLLTMFPPFKTSFLQKQQDIASDFFSNDLQRETKRWAAGDVQQCGVCGVIVCYFTVEDVEYEQSLKQFLWNIIINANYNPHDIGRVWEVFQDTEEDSVISSYDRNGWTHWLCCLLSVSSSKNHQNWMTSVCIPERLLMWAFF